MSAFFCIFSFRLKEVNVIIQGSVKLDSPYVGLLELPPANQSYPPGDSRGTTSSPLLRIQLKLNTALLSTVRVFVCSCVRVSQA